MSADEEKQSALVLVQSTALTKAGAKSLATRGRSHLRDKEEAKKWLRKGLALQEAASHCSWPPAPINPHAKIKSLPHQIQIAAKYIRRVLAGSHPDVAAGSLGMTSEDQELAHVAHFFMPNALAEAVGDSSALAAENGGNSAEPIATHPTSEPSTAPPTIPSPAGMDNGVLSKATMEIVGKLILEFERIKEKKQQTVSNLRQRTEILKEAFQCFECGFELDPSNPELLYWLAHSYHQGCGVSENEVKAVALYQRAADMGHAGSQTAIGDAYAQCDFRCLRCLPRDYKQAAKWYQAAAEQGDEDAVRMIVDMYQRGEGIEQNHAEAARLLRKAAANGDERASDDLTVYAEMYGWPYDGSGADTP